MKDGAYFHYYQEDFSKRSLVEEIKGRKRNAEAVTKFNERHITATINTNQLNQPIQDIRQRRYEYPDESVEMPLPLLQIQDPVSADESGKAHSNNAQEHLLWFLQSLDWAHVHRGRWTDLKTPDTEENELCPDISHIDAYWLPQVDKYQVSYNEGGLTIRNTLGPTWKFFGIWVAVAFVIAILLGGGAGVGFTCLHMKKKMKKKPEASNLSQEKMMIN